MPCRSGADNTHAVAFPFPSVVPSNTNLVLSIASGEAQPALLFARVGARPRTLAMTSALETPAGGDQRRGGGGGVFFASRGGIGMRLRRRETQGHPAQGPPPSTQETHLPDANPDAIPFCEASLAELNELKALCRDLVRARDEPAVDAHARALVPFQPPRLQERNADEWTAADEWAVAVVPRDQRQHRLPRLEWIPINALDLDQLRTVRRRLAIAQQAHPLPPVRPPRRDLADRFAFHYSMCRDIVLLAALVALLLFAIGYVIGYVVAGLWQADEEPASLEALADLCGLEINLIAPTGGDTPYCARLGAKLKRDGEAAL